MVTSFLGAALFLKRQDVFPCALIKGEALREFSVSVSVHSLGRALSVPWFCQVLRTAGN